MTENSRFERVYGDIEVVCIDHDSIDEDRFFDDGDYDKFVKSLNELNDENEQLKKDNQVFYDKLNAHQDLIKEILLKFIVDYDKISKDNYDFGLKECVEHIHDEIEELFDNPLRFCAEYGIDVNRIM